MNPVICHLASGMAFFSGIGLVVAAVLAGGAMRRRWIMAVLNVLVLVGMGLAGLSATPLAGWVYGAWVAAVVGGLVAQRWVQRAGRRWLLRGMAVAACLGVAAVEAPYQVSRGVARGSWPRMYVIGDSISAGMGNGVRTWPQVFRDRYGVEVVDLSRAGETVASALQHIRGQSFNEGLVLLEIGGNDLLGSTPAEQFEANLAKLIEATAGPGRQVVMVELPLLPLKNAFGRAQRRLAREHGVLLIPKGRFMSVLSGPEATLDGLHLSAAGHERMAEMVWEMVGGGSAAD